MPSCPLASTSATPTASRSRPSSERSAARGDRRGECYLLRPHLEPEPALLERDVAEVADPVAEHEELAAALAALVGVVEVPDHDRVESLGEARLGDLAPQAVAVEVALVARLAREAGDPACEREAEVGMQQPKQRDAGGVA